MGFALPEGGSDARLRNWPDHQCAGSAEPIAQIAIGRPAPKERLRITVVLPNNVTLGTNVRMGLGEKAEQALALGWRRCLPMGCFADAELPEDQLRRFRVATEQGRTIFSDGAGREIALPFSFNGLAQAIDALPFGVIRLDREGLVKLYSTPEAEQSGFTHRPALGLDFFEQVEIGRAHV